MVFFRVKPNLSDGEKARLEFHFQQIAECLGANRLKLPVISMRDMLARWESNPDVAAFLDFVGDHLDHGADAITVHVAPQIVANCSGGG